MLRIFCLLLIFLTKTLKTLKQKLLLKMLLIIFLQNLFPKLSIVLDQFQRGKNF